MMLRARTQIMLCLVAQMKKSKSKDLDFLCNEGKKDIYGSFRMDLNTCVNEASAYADMKHSLRSYEVFATQI